MHLQRPARLVVAGPDGEARVLWPDPRTTTVGELARAVGIGPGDGVAIDGRPVPVGTVLGRSGACSGSVVTAVGPAGTGSGTPDGAPVAGVAAVVDVVVVAGPAVGPPVHLGPGRHLVGRAPDAAVRIADPLVEPHHALLDVAADGMVTLLQLAGRVPAIVGGAPAGGPAAVDRDVTVEIGASRVLVTAVADRKAPAVVGPVAGDPWRRTLLRGPRPGVQRVEASLTPPPPPPERAGGAWGAVGALVSLAGALAVAAVMRQPALALLGAVGAAASLATAGSGRVREARLHRRDLRRDREACGRFVEAVRLHTGEARRHAVAGAVSRAVSRSDPAAVDMWARRPAHGDAFVVTVGWGSQRLAEVPGVDGDDVRADLRPAVEAASLLGDVPVEVDLAADAQATLAIAGRDAPAVARSLVVQLAVQCGPADWRLVVVTDDRDTWRWATWLPHATMTGGPAVVDAADPTAVAAALERLDDGVARHAVVVTDVPSLLATRTSALRQFLAGARPVSTIVVTGDVDAVPAWCQSALEIGTRCRARWTHRADGSLGPERLHAAGLSVDTAAAVARRLAGYVDPEDPSGSAALPADLRLCELPDVPGDAAAIAASWRSAGADPAPAAPIGATTEGFVEVDLVRDGPHALVAGTTGSGKSEALRTLVVALAARLAPDHVTFVLVDYKGGATFDACAALPHTVGVVTDLDDGLATRALVSLDAEVRRRERLLRDAGAVDLAAYRAVRGAPPLPRLVVVVDEFAALVGDLPGFVTSLVAVAQRGRSLGLHLVLATQRPAGVVDEHIRANTNLRLALRLHDRADALDVVGDEAPARLPRGVPGRAVMRLGPGELVELQVASCTAAPPGGDGSELDRLVGEIRRAAALVDTAPPHRPWVPALPAELHEVEAPGVVGLVDEPAAQRRTPLRWDRDRGNLALVGALGSGTTTALRAVVGAAAGAAAPRALHVYVVDGRGDGVLAALAGPHCGGIVGVHEAERVDRVVRRLAGELDRRRAASRRDRGADVVFAVDGLTAVRESLDDPTRAAVLADLDRVLTDGPGVGIATAAVIEPARGATTVLPRFAERWVFHLDDPADGPMLGVASTRVPPAVPGRLVVAASGLEAQIALVDHVPLDGAGGPAPVEVLPRVVPASSLRREPAPDGSVDRLAVGLDFDTLETAVLDVPAGEHVMVVGPPRSGRSSALIRLVEAWRLRHPDAPVAVICPARTSPLVTRYGAVDLDRARLIVVDDCEHVDDADGRLAALLGEPSGAVQAFVAGRGDALRADYGHWSGRCRRSRLGVVMAAGGELDGDLLGTALPRRPPIPARPGLAWIVGTAVPSLVQVALDDDTP